MDDGKANGFLYQSRVSATQYNFVTLKFTSILHVVLYSQHKLIRSCRDIAHGAIKQRSST